MLESKLRRLLADVGRGRLSVDGAVDALRRLPYEDLGYAKLDHHRPLRQGLPEVIFVEGKSPEHLLAIMRRLRAQEVPVLATRVSPSAAAYLKRRLPGVVYHQIGRVALLRIDGAPATSFGTTILILTAGTADLPVAEEARLTAETFGHRVETLYDVGVAGLHRLTDQFDALQRADALIVVAGMEGALPSIVGGMTSRPVIAVPTSRGYGAHFGGIAPLLTMLTSCAAGLAVVNIDNGFGAAALAHRILASGRPHARRPRTRRKGARSRG